MEVVYIETSIAGVYHEIRRTPDMVDRRRQTRIWWHEHAANYRLVTSQYVIDELEDGEYPTKAAAVKFLDGLTRLEDVTDDITDIVSVYLENKLMPKDDDDGDAWHLAMAAFHRCDYLLSWNCRHLANPNKLGHIRTLNARLRLSTPRLVTPAILLREAQNVRSRAGSTTPES